MIEGINALYFTDGYKPGHKAMLAPGTTKLYGTWIPRSVKHAPKGVNKIVSIGSSVTVRFLKDLYGNNFFSLPKEKAMKFGVDMQNYLGLSYDASHFEDLYELGYLPIKIKSLPEGVETNPNIPHMTFVNTVDGYGWLTLFLETFISSISWKLCTSATISLQFKRNLVEQVMKTDPDNVGLIPFLIHDFSARGLSPWDMITSGLGHAFNFRGSDSLVTIPAARHYYGLGDDEMPINSVNASEHSVSTTKIFTVGEKNMIKDWLKIFPKGILSIVADTFDLWKLTTEYLVELKDEILSRDGKVVIRPDCYSEDTLFLTNYGWKSIDAIKKGALVAQVEDDGSYTFVKPTKIVDEFYEGEMYKYTNLNGKMDLLVTPNHRMVYKQFDNWKIDYAEDCKPNNHTKKFIRSARATNKHRKLSFIERLNIAFQADGSYQTGEHSYIRFSLSKIRKIQRLEKLLKDNNIEYTTHSLSDGKTEFSVKIDRSQVSKDFNWVKTDDLCSNWSQEFIEELSHWNSTIRNKGRVIFDTTNSNIMSIVELIALSAGYGCLVSEYEDKENDPFSKVYTANILLDNKIGGQSIKVEKTNYKGNVVCVTVPTGKIVVKRNRCTMVCGNSGDPVDIICGEAKESNLNYDQSGRAYPDNIQDYDSCDGVWSNNGKYYKLTGLPNHAEWTEINSEPQHKGVIELLWDIFGGTINEQGYKVLDPHIGAIYGDSITVDRQRQIYERLESKGFACTNIVLGVGAFTYQMNTRDTFGFAAKGSWFEVKDEKTNEIKSYDIYKDPITDDGTKKSLKGRVKVYLDDNNEYQVKTQCSEKEETEGELRTVFENGVVTLHEDFNNIRNKLDKLV